MSNHHLRNPVLTLKAKGLLSLMLSLPDDWDYTLRGLSRICRESVDAIRTAIWELEQAGYITRRQGRDEKGKMTAIENTIYEQPVPEDPLSENPTTDNPVSENTTQSNKDKQNKELPITISNQILSLPFDERGGKTDRKGRMGLDGWTKIVKENIEYDVLKLDSNIPTAQLDELVSLMTDTLCSQRETIRIAGDDYPAEAVKQRFLAINSAHIQFAAECMRENTSKIRNIRKYLLAVLYNAPVTMEHYYTAQVNYDLAE